MILYQDTYSEIIFWPDTGQLYLKWRCEPSESDLLRIYEKAIGFAGSTRARSLVVDNSIGFTVTIAMQRSLASLAIRQLHVVEVRKFARVTPSDVFQEIITHKVLDEINALSGKCIEVAYFHNLEEAKAWANQPTAQEERQKN